MELLVIKPSSLGDIIHGLVVVESLRFARPEIRVTWVVRDVFEPFVAACETVAETITFERKGGVAGWVKLFKILNSQHFDAVLDLQGLLRSGLMTGVACAPRKLGRLDAREGSSFFYNEQPALPLLGKKSHALEILLQFLPLFGVPAAVQGILKFKEAADFKGCVADVKAGSIILFPNSRRVEKEWPYFVKLTNELLDCYPDYPFVWAGDQGGDLLNGLKNRPNLLDMRGKIPISALPALINCARLVIANDSGPVHLAAAMGKEVLALFGPTNSALYGPYPLNRPIHHVIQAPGGDLSLLPMAAVKQVIIDIFGSRG